MQDVCWLDAAIVAAGRVFGRWPPAQLLALVPVMEVAMEPTWEQLTPLEQYRASRLFEFILRLRREGKLRRPA
jgi:hypothetical protein